MRKARCPLCSISAKIRTSAPRGTAVFALGEIGSDKAAPLLSKVVAEDRSEMVRRLAQEALQKIRGDLPTERTKTMAADSSRQTEPTDEKLVKLREMDQKMQDMDR